MTRLQGGIVCATLGLVAVGAGLGLARGAGAANPKLVYGADDRLDQYQVSPALQSLGQATAVFLPLRNLASNADGSYTISGGTLADRFAANGEPLCPDEPFADQPEPGYCSGFLVGPDLLVTAGHCFSPTQPDASEGLNTFALVFGFAMNGPGSPAMDQPADNVYFARQVVARVKDDSTGADYGVLRLDRPVTVATPLAVSSTPPYVGQPALVIGYPSGLPIKYAGGASVRRVTNGPFLLSNLDTYGGNSGSPVIDPSTDEVIGILVSGNQDYETVDGCTRSVRCPDAGCPEQYQTSEVGVNYPWERVTKASVWDGVVNQALADPSYIGPSGGTTGSLSLSTPLTGGAGSGSNGSAATIGLCGPLGLASVALTFAGLALVGRWVRRRA